MGRETSLVLAIEPDSSRADALRQLLRERLGIELVLVSSPYAAIVAMNRHLPELVLFSSKLSDRNQNKVVDHYRSLTDGIDPQTLIIPLLSDSAAEEKQNSRFSFKWKRQSRGSSADVFIETISTYLKRSSEAAAQQAASDTTPSDRPATPTVAKKGRRGAAAATAEATPAETATAEASSDETVTVPVLPQTPASEPIAASAGTAETTVEVTFPEANLVTPDANAVEMAAAATESATPPINGETAGTWAAPLAPSPALNQETPSLTGDEVLLDVSLDDGVDMVALAAGPADAVPGPSSAEVESDLSTNGFAALYSQFDIDPATMAIQVDESVDAESDRGIDLSELLNAGPAHPVIGPMMEPGIDPEVHAAEIALIKLEAEQKLASELERLRLETVQQREAELARLHSEAEALRQATVANAREAAETEAREALASELARVRAETEQTISDALNRVKAEADQSREADANATQERLAQMVELHAEAARQSAEAQARADQEAEARESLAAELARVRSEAERTLSDALDRVRQEAAETVTNEVARAREHAEQSRSEELARLHASVDERLNEATRQARELAETEAARRFSEELTRARQHAEQTLTSELERVKAEAQIAVEAHTERARADASEREADVARAQAEAEALRQAAINEARTAAEEAAARALEGEVARVKAEAEARVQEEVDRLRSEADLARSERSEVAAEAEKVREAAREVEREIARVRAESAARLQEELDRVRAEAERVRDADRAARAEAERLRDAAAQDAQVEAEALRQQAIVEARAAAEEAAARALDREVARVRGEAEARVQAEVDRLRTEAERARSDRTEAKAEAKKVRQAAREVEREIARVREESEQRLEEELARVRTEAERAREAERTLAREEAERLREAAAQDARAVAEAALKSELERVRAESESRLSAEVTQLRAEADRQRVSEIAELRAQLTQVRDSAAQHAQKAAADAIAAEMARSTRPAPMSPFGAPPPPFNPNAPRPDPQQAWKPAPAAEPADARTFAVPSMHRGMPQPERPAPRPVPDPSADAPAKPAPSRSTWAGFSTPPPTSQPSWMKLKWPAAAAFALIVGGVASYNWLGVRVQWNATNAPPAAAPVNEAPAAPPPARVGADVVIESSPPGANISIDGKNMGVAPLTLRDVTVGNHTVLFEADGLEVSRTIRVRENEPVSLTQDMTAGFLSVFSRVPVEVRIDGRRAGNNEEGQIIVQPGVHKVLLENPRFNFRSEFDIEIKPTEVTAHTVMLPMGALRVTTEPGTEVWVEGERVGVAPLGPIAVPIGTRDVVVRSNGSEAKQGVEIVYGRQAELKISAVTPPVTTNGGPPAMPPLTGAVPGGRLDQTRTQER